MVERKTLPNALRSQVADRVPLQRRAPTFSPGLLEMRVLARVNGSWNVARIADDLELAPAEVMAVLERLERIGAVQWQGVVMLEADDLEEEADGDRETSPDLSFERPTWPSAPPAIRP